MKKNIHKLFWAWEFEKEEKWLNEMAAKGLHLTDIGFCRYTFEEGTPGEYQYRLELLDHFPNHPESVQYIRFMEETGAEQIGSLMRWVYFRKRAETGSFELFSDIDSRIKHLQRVNCLMIPLLVMELAVGADNLALGISLSSSVNLGCAVPSLLLGLLIGVGVIQISKNIRRLKRERDIRE